MHRRLERVLIKAGSQHTQQSVAPERWELERREECARCRGEPHGSGEAGSVQVQPAACYEPSQARGADREDLGVRRVAEDAKQRGQHLPR